MEKIDKTKAAAGKSHRRSRTSLSRQPGPSRSSHVIPSRLLSQFAKPQVANPEDRRHWKLWAYAKDRQPREMPVSAFVHNDFYAFTDDNGEENHEHEPRMAQTIEGPFNQLLPSIESDLYTTNRSDLIVIAKYVANLFHRTHQRRTASLMQQTETAACAEEFIKDDRRVKQLAAAYSMTIGCAVSLKMTRDGLASLAQRDSAARNRFFLENLERHENDLFRMLQDKPYGVLRAPRGAAFLLTDTAVLTRLPIGTFVSIGEGFSKPGVHTLLPISPRTCLQIGIPNLQSHNLRGDEVQSINQDQIKLMHRWAYSGGFNREVEANVNSFGGTVRYKVNAFATPQLTPDRMLDMLTVQILDDFSSGRMVSLRRKRAGSAKPPTSESPESGIA
jgi:hypothetical protein